MMRKIIFILVAMFLGVHGGAAGADDYKIGVLAKRGAIKALKKWKATGEYLTSQIPGATFEIVPLDFDQVNPAVQNSKVDFFLVNSSMFVTAKIRYNASAIATMINSRQGKALKSFGGVIITSIDNDDINSLKDMKGRSFMAVKKSSFGGWQMAYNEMKSAGIDPFKDFSKLEFGGKHDNVALAVLNMVADCGTVRTDTLERMTAEGLIDIEDLKIINQQSHPGFPFVCSTPLYPEWPLAKTEKTPSSIAKKVTEALKQLKKSDLATRNARIVGWTDPLDYNPVEQLQGSLNVGAFAVNSK
ncbi:MAG: phosphate/phosphite/phosphonate ABC transporter substrate-binding protein [Desulfobacteraceae bacterium]|nr:phosphate/phosphite/phosphonate ABC transporter substrate-binding protein [Desulfobacteraceae bacterium]